MEIKKTETPDNLRAGKPCILALEDGRTFRGLSFGADDSFNTVLGELVFNTSMYGYQEIMTDPSYAGQIVTFTSPEIGNYGTNDNDMESRQIYARGMVVRHLSRRHSSWRAQQSLDQFLKDHGVLGISDVDTRAITKHIRSKGAMCHHHGYRRESYRRTRSGCAEGFEQSENGRSEPYRRGHLSGAIHHG